MTLLAGLAMLGFVSIFHIIGGAAIGSGLRRLSHGFALQPIFFIVWGVFFGVLPLYIGVSELTAKGFPLFFAAEIMVLLGTILLVAFVPDWIAEAFQSQNIYLILFGSVFLLTGIGAGIAAWQESIAAGLAMFFAFGSLGTFMFGMGLTKLLKGK